MSPFYTYTLLIEIICCAYFAYKIHSISYIKKLNKWLSWIIPIGICGALIGFSYFKIAAVCVAMMHFMTFMVIADLIAFFIGKKLGKKIWIHNFIAIGFTVIYLGISLIFGLVVFKTNYSISTQKTNKSLKIAQITDVHLGATFGGEGFREYMEEIDALHPDMLVITGDFVDDETTLDDMVVACKALGDMHLTYGVFFVHGNHDEGYYPQYRDFQRDDLEAELTKNNVTILEDDYRLIDNDFYIIGRKDRSNPSRKPMDELIKDLDNDKYKILLDHQPNDYDNEKGKVDLVISGHTHGGNIIPVNFMVLLANDQVYGIKEIDGTNFIVSSGISDWALPYNNVAIQEYVIIDINKKDSE